MGGRQVPKFGNGITIPEIGDDPFSNSDHIPVYRDVTGNYSWIESGYGNN